VDPLSQLAHAARVGEPDALQRFVEAAYEPVWRLCAAVVDARSADDLAQETFLRAHEAIHHFRGDAPAGTWILSIARHTCMDELRSRTRRRRDLPMLTRVVSDPSEPVAMADLLARLSPDRRLAFVLTQVTGLSYQEAATACACPVGTIRSRVARARADLVNALMESDSVGQAAPRGPGSRSAC
jgi:RNA polymerase sigma-70 factor (ECF subfamily)